MKSRSPEIRFEISKSHTLFFFGGCEALDMYHVAKIDRIYFQPERAYLDQ